MATRILNLPIYKLEESPYQGRIFSKEALEKNKYAKKQLEELAESISNVGLMQPITVRIKGDKYEIIDGHRRVAAYRMLDKGNIPAIIKEGSDKEIQMMSVVANIQRTDLSNLERALAFEKILAEGLFQNKKELSRAIGKDETYVGNVLNILKMDKRIITDLSKKDRIGDLRMLRLIRNVEPVNFQGVSNKQYKLYLKCITQKYTRKQLQELLQKQQNIKAVYKISQNKSGFSFTFSDNIETSKKKQAMELLEVKMKEVMKELGIGSEE